jgi:phenylpyruvate tautomerase PptA (4-oxalocrotonate tautomerase family)
MPFLKIQTNVAVDKETRASLLSRASQHVAEILGKPEKYVVVSLEHNPDMLFSGTTAPLAYLELKSIGLPGENTASYSQSICDLIKDVLDIDIDRIYIEFANADRHMWGWNGATF